MKLLDCDRAAPAGVVKLKWLFVVLLYLSIRLGDFVNFLYHLGVNLPAESVPELTPIRKQILSHRPWHSHQEKII